MKDVIKSFNVALQWVAENGVHIFVGHYNAEEIQGF
jgi:hypothetical protein